MPSTLDILESARALLPEIPIGWPQAPLATIFINDGVREIQRQTEGWYRKTLEQTIPADTQQVIILRNRNDIELIKLRQVWVSDIPQNIVDVAQIRINRASDNWVTTVQTITAASVGVEFALNKEVENENFGTVALEIWPKYSTEVTALLEMQLLPDDIADMKANVYAPLDAMTCYFAWRMALKQVPKLAPDLWTQFLAKCASARAERDVTGSTGLTIRNSGFAANQSSYRRRGA